MKSISIFLLILFFFCGSIIATDSLSSNKMSKEYLFFTESDEGAFSKKNNLDIAVYPYPLKGNFMKEGYDSLFIVSTHILEKYGTVKGISKKQLRTMLNQKKCPFDLLVLPLEVSHNITEEKSNDQSKNTSSLLGFMGSGFFSFEEIDFIAYDCKEEKIVWQFSVQKQEGWFIPKQSRRNEITEIGQLTRRLQFNQFAQQISFKLNAEIKNLFSNQKNNKKMYSNL